jgi:hypothetical protein
MNIPAGGIQYNNCHVYNHIYNYGYRTVDEVITLRDHAFQQQLQRQQLARTAPPPPTAAATGNATAKAKGRPRKSANTESEESTSSGATSLVPTDVVSSSTEIFSPATAASVQPATPTATPKPKGKAGLAVKKE